MCLSFDGIASAQPADELFAEKNVGAYDGDTSIFDETGPGNKKYDAEMEVEKVKRERLEKTLKHEYASLEKYRKQCSDSSPALRLTARIICHGLVYEQRYIQCKRRQRAAELEQKAAKKKDAEISRLCRAWKRGEMNDAVMAEKRIRDIERGVQAAIAEERKIQQAKDLVAKYKARAEEEARLRKLAERTEAENRQLREAARKKKEACERAWQQSVNPCGCYSVTGMPEKFRDAKVCAQ